jgi:hypothetical protein
MLTELVGGNMNEIIKATLGSGAFPNATEEEKKQIDEFIDMVVIAQKPDDVSACIPYEAWKELYEYGFDSKPVKTDKVDEVEGDDLWDLV